MAGTSLAMTLIHDDLHGPGTEARAAGGRGEVPVGCVIVRDGEVIARAGNRTVADRDPTAHAELMAIREAARRSARSGSTIAISMSRWSPAPCARAPVAFARIRRLYYGAADPKGGAVDNGVKFFASPTCHHRPEVYGGLAEAEAGSLLKDFFRERR